MPNDQSVTLARISELLDAVDSSSRVLRTFLEQETTPIIDEYSTTIADFLGLPFHADSVVAGQASLLRIACERLARIVTPPRHVIFEAAGSFYTTVALQVALKSDIASLIEQELKKNNLDNVHVDILASRSGLDSDLLTRTLRYLSVRGVFQEIDPGRFSNTTASSMLINNPEFKAHLDLLIQEGQLAAPFILDLMVKRFQASHDSGGDVASPPSAFSLYTSGQMFYPWLHSSANSNRAKNFNLAMRGMSHNEGLAFLPVDYPFHALPAGKLVVDVGGGIGSVPQLLLPSVPHLRFVVQDIEPVIAQALESPGPDMKKWIAEKKVQFRVHDCFTSQPPELEGAVFILKNILHNYPDTKALQILKGIRSSEPFKLLVIDRLVVPHLRTEATTAAGEAAIYRKLCAKDIVSNNQTGSAGIIPATPQGIPTMYDLVMGSLHGGRTRTLDEWRTLLLQGGFQLEMVYPMRASTGQALLEAHFSSETVPVESE